MHFLFLQFVFIYSFTLLLVLKEIKGVIPYLSAKSSQVCKTQGTTSLFNITFVKVVLKPKRKLDDDGLFITLYIYLKRRAF